MKVTLLLLAFCFAFAYANLDDYVNTPHHRVHKNCVHHIPSGTHVHRDDIGNYFLRFADGSEKMHPPCEYPPMVHGRAWKAWTQYHNTDGFTFMSANWPAPPAPAVPSNIEILYYWPGTEPDDNSFVIQPVVCIFILFLEFFFLFIYSLFSFNMVLVQLEVVNIGLLQGMLTCFLFFFFFFLLMEDVICISWYVGDRAFFSNLVGRFC